MKKYIIFAVSFVVLYALFQVLSGMVLTYIYTPDLEEAWTKSGNLSQEAVLLSDRQSLLLPFIFAFVSASLAYFIPQKTSKNASSN
ncbi:hypothetical protein SAMN05216389_101230 [Oceanobacillus limi]|uniref:Uncharacterized protein n=1 Tax=Oceanobacillus limi TaxID=930131 RepID=A0A1H9Y747_9BACI|nr:hypothetical protein [Oceanobacillus limi]SES64596.1 hypothetical protein SAMN05216389_101230 [Oceanobacillus limi]